VRELTIEQLELLQELKTDAYKEIQRRAQEDLRRERALAEARVEMYRAQAAVEEARRKAAIKPLLDALRAAGIKLSVESYGYDPSILWVKAELPDGTKVDEEFDEINTEEDT
jgi:beta-phosphoglucomutase-like phosphatase (HAD superfamily)